MNGPGKESVRSMPGIPGPFGGASDEACSAIQGPGSLPAFKGTSRAWLREYTRQSSFGDYQPYAIKPITTNPSRRIETQTALSPSTLRLKPQGT